MSTQDDGGVLTPLTRISLDGGGCVLVEQQDERVGPVEAGRISDAVRELPVTLEGALEPVTKAARAIFGQLRKAHPDQITVEFDVDLPWKGRSDHPHADTSHE
ncbi:CU044_2847 family protein [Streptomyces sp. NPDC048258]|uniref:CU044_2847 family protein n=1 Tax=Streptomyces sp. NPDC048258 TaxID=3365527 RepID=UPI0037196F04